MDIQMVNISYMVGAQTIAGIQASTINTKQKITVIDAFIFYI
jgi:hypothetical protein